MNINDYGEQLRAAGWSVVAGSESTIWVSYARFAMQRQPDCAMHPPSTEEIQNVFKRSHALMLSFAVEPSSVWRVSSWLYVCCNHDYSLQTLGQSARSHTRRSLREFQIGPLEHRELLNLGLQAYCDTRTRVGLSDGTANGFEAGFCRPRPGTRYFGALKDNRLAAFLSATEVDDCVAIQGYSANEFLPLRPNNGLIYHALHYYLVEKQVRTVSYGLSSIQALANSEGLHRFKLKMGFEAHPVHRAFLVNPLLKPFVNRFSWRLASGLMKLSPANPMLRKAEGALRFALQETKPANVVRTENQGV